MISLPILPPSDVQFRRVATGERLNEGNGTRNSSRFCFAISKKGSGANPVPTACGIGGTAGGFPLPFQWDPNLWEMGPEIWQMGPYIRKGTHILQVGPVSNGCPEADSESP